MDRVLGLVHSRTEIVNAREGLDRILDVFVGLNQVLDHSCAKVDTPRHDEDSGQRTKSLKSWWWSCNLFVVVS